MGEGMGDRDYYLMAACCGLLAVAGLLQLRMIRSLAAQAQATSADVEFLKIVARETEARRSD